MSAAEAAGGAREGGPETVGDAAADEVAERAERPRRLVRALRELGALDRAIYMAVAASPTPTLDRGLRRLSNAANHSKVWVGVAVPLALAGGRGRTAARDGSLALLAASALVNLGLKNVMTRARPARDSSGVIDARRVRMPTSSSFPSGHSASGFAFANAVGGAVPVLALPLRLAAAAVAYSRVHTGVHYPADTVLGAIVGAAVGEAVRSALHRGRALG